MHARTDPNLGWYFLFGYTGSILLNSFLLGSDFFFKILKFSSQFSKVRHFFYFNKKKRKLLYLPKAMS